MKLQVREEDAASAQELLDAEIPALLMDDTAGEIYQQPQCPRCDSFDIGYGPNKAGKILSWLVLGFPLPIPGRKRWNCRDCGAQWIEVPDQPEPDQPTW